MFETTIREGVLQLFRERTRWLSTGWAGGERVADAAYNVSVPDGWTRTDLAAYLDERLSNGSFSASGPALFTGVDLRHARCARYGSVQVVATAGVSNPAALPMASESPPRSLADPDGTSAGTVNVIVGTTRALAPGALANLVAVAAEAKAATLLHETGFPGTTTDALVVACDPTGARTEFSGSATPVGAATRACVRDAVRASLASRYADEPQPGSVAEAEYGCTTSERPKVYAP